MTFRFDNSSELSRATLRRFLFLFLPLGGLLLAVAAYHYQIDTTTERENQQNNEILNVEMAQQIISGELRTVISDLMFLSKLNEIWPLLDDPENVEAGHMLALEFLYFSEKKGIYDQIRVTDSKGMEVVRINYVDGNPAIVPRSELQDKSNRYYFVEAYALELGGIYISPFDLNVESGQIEKPYKSEIRFATPLFDSEGRKRGLLLLNFRGEKLLQRFKLSTRKMSERGHLVNARGFWLSSPIPENNWGFMFGHHRSFSRFFPEVWEYINESDSGFFYSSKGLFTFATVYPKVAVMHFYGQAGSSGVSSVKYGTVDNRDYFWKIVSHVTPQMLSKISKQFTHRYLLFYLSMGLILFMSSLVVAYTTVRSYLTKAQHEQEKRFRETLETIQLAAVTLDINGCVSFCNDFFLGLTGWARDEVINRDWFDTFISDKDQDRLREWFTQLINGEIAPAAIETHIVTRREDLRLVSWSITVSKQPNGTVTGITGIGEDITDQRKNEDSLRKLSQAVEQSPNPVIITNTKGMIEYVNPRFTQLSGYTAEEAIGQNPRLLQSGETLSGTYEDLWQTITAGRHWRGILRNRKKNGELYWENTAISPIRGSRGKITHFLAIKEDVTESLRLQKEAKERKRELARSKTLAALGRMAAIMAHDLRNPLSSIKMVLQILRKQKNQKRKEENEELNLIALDQVRYMEAILADLLQFSRPDELNPEWLSVNKLLDTAVLTTQKAVSEHHATIITDYHPKLPTIHADATKLCQAFSNLIMNALQATANADRNAKIHIRTYLDLGEQGPKIKVHDNGPGIDVSKLDNFFEPFFTTRAKGTGLGLPIVKNIIEQHKGSINLLRAKKHGTIAIVVLPTNVQ